MAKIVIVLNSSWNVWNFRLPLLLRLQEMGHQVEVIAPSDDYVKKIPFPCHHVHIQSSSTNPFADTRIFLSLLREFRNIRPDIALLYTAKPNIYGNFAAALTGTRTISNVAGLGAVFISKGVVTTLVKWLYRLALRVPHKVFFQNNDDRKMFIQEGIVASYTAQHIPGSGIDLERFSPKINADNRDRKFVFLLPARMLWDKGVGEYVEAAKLILNEGHNAEFRLLGFIDVDNPRAISREEMDIMTRHEGIKYIGVSDRVEDEISAADCLVLPSYREGTPKALLEAAAMAKPIITTDTAGCRDVVDNGLNGFLCKVRDSSDLYKKMQRMLSLSEDERIEMGKRGRMKMKLEFDQQIVIEQYVMAINEILIEMKDKS